MTVAALMLVRDEVDIIAYTLEHLREQVDACYVLDNRSIDGTSDILDEYREEQAGWLHVEHDPEVGYWQARKTTALADRARDDGHGWVLPCDADERWEAPGGHIGDYLRAVGPDVQIVGGRLWNHIPTDADPDDLNPYSRIGWRLVEPGALPKVAARAHPALHIHAGNHGADYGRIPHLAIVGMEVRHYSWRTPQQYLRKIRNGIEAYAATDLHATLGAHWRGHAGKTDEEILSHYDAWFMRRDPENDPDLVYDPAVRP